VCATSAHNTTQNSSDDLPSYLQTTITAQMLSIGEGSLDILKLTHTHQLLAHKEWEHRGQIYL